LTNIAVSERGRWVGSSESAALLGIESYSTLFKLWHQKAGTLPADNLDRNERVQAGQFFEPAIANWAAHKWGMHLSKVHHYREHPTVEGMGASLDWETHSGEPVEIKNVDVSVFNDPTGEWDHERDVLTNAPAKFLVQVQHQLACPPPRSVPAQRGWLVVCVGGNQLFRMEVPRHDGLIAMIEQRVTEFWQSIRENNPPTPDFLEDAPTISRLYRGLGLDVIDLRGNPRARELGEKYLAAHAEETAAKAVKTGTLAELKFLMQDARAALLGGGLKVTASHIEEATIQKQAHWRFAVRKSKE
jgi:hypothetical protein